MKVAIPVKNENLDIFTNAGHTPFFAIFEITGSGSFKTTKLLALRDNPRVNLEAEAGCQHEHDGIEHDEAEHKKEHGILVDIIQDCGILLVKKACKNTASVMGERGILLKKIPAEVTNANDALRFAF